MNNFLEEIVGYKNKLNAEKKAVYSAIAKGLSSSRHSRYQVFKKSISKPGKLNLIAEIKKASPSKGLIRKDFDLLKIAEIYQKQKVDAISVLTEDKYFLGKPEYVKKVSDNCDVPVLAKDFFIDEGQIYEAAFNGASAVLLIAAILKDAQLKKFAELAGSLDLDCLFEVHSEDELKKALDFGAEIIGINNRDLKIFEVDLSLCEKLIPKMPKGKIVVVESGIENHSDIKRIKDLGASAVLIGESLMRADDIGAKIEEIMHGQD